MIKKIKYIWVLMVVLVILDGLLTRYGLANGGIELNPFVDVSNLALHQMLELLGVSFLIFLNALSITYPTTVLGANMLRVTTRANRVATWVLFIVVTWNSFNIIAEVI